jgi:uncharacterized protein YchJ
MEKLGIISVLKRFEPSYGHPVVLHGTDGHEDLYFAYDIDRMEERTPLRVEDDPCKLSDSLAAFCRRFKAEHTDAVFAKGRIHVHYCAWPMAPPKPIPPFRTVDGYIYGWRAFPFDYPFSSHLWQLHVQKVLNSKFSFVHFYQTTFIISASHPRGAAENLKTLILAAEREGWRLSVPEPQEWTADIDELDASTLWKGIPPAALGYTS